MLDLLELLQDVSSFYLGSFMALTFCIYYVFEVAKIPTIACAPGPFLDFLDKHVPILKTKFYPLPWCFESRFQTVLANAWCDVFTSSPKFHREILNLPDGGEVALDWLEGSNCKETTPIIIILTGITGDVKAGYIKLLTLTARDMGLRCVVYQYRGLGGVPLKTSKSYCACNIDDLVEVIEYVHKKNPRAPLAATGISLGGIQLGQYLVQKNALAATRLRAAFAISTPWNAIEATKSIEQPYLNLMLCRHLSSRLCDVVRQYNFPEWTQKYNVDIPKVLQSKTVREFDENFTRKVFGFKDSIDYYKSASLNNKLHLIKVPLLCLNAADDPFQPLYAIPIKEASQLENVAIVVTARGGHNAFVNGLWISQKTQYMQQLFCEYFSAVFTVGIETNCKSTDSDN